MEKEEEKVKKEKEYSSKKIIIKSACYWRNVDEKENFSKSIDIDKEKNDVNHMRKKNVFLTVRLMTIFLFLFF